MFEENDNSEGFNSLFSDDIYMGVALSVYKLVNPNKELLLKEKITSKTQMTWQDFKLVSKISDATSNLEFVAYDEKNDKVEYEALHYSDTIAKPIRVFLDEIQEPSSEFSPVKELPMVKGRTKIIEKGYQEVYKFKVIIDFKTNEIFIFTKKEIADQFMNRFGKSGKIEYALPHLNLSKIDEVTEIANVWGVWEDSKGRCNKKAFFGTEVHKEAGVEKKLVTNYNVIYQYDEADIDLLIDVNCKISSRSKIMTDVDLVKIYKILKEKLGFVETEESTEISQEQE